MIDPTKITLGAKQEKPAAVVQDQKSEPKSLTHPEPLDFESFPHLRKRADGKVSPKATIENLEHLLDGYGIEIAYDVMAKERIVNVPGLSILSDNYYNIAIETICSLASLNDIPLT